MAVIKRALENQKGVWNMSMLIKNGQILINDELIHSDIYIEEGKIKEIGKLDSVYADEVINASRNGHCSRFY